MDKNEYYKLIREYFISFYRIMFRNQQTSPALKAEILSTIDEAMPNTTTYGRYTPPKKGNKPVRGKHPYKEVKSLL